MEDNEKVIFQQISPVTHLIKMKYCLREMVEIMYASVKVNASTVGEVNNHTSLQFLIISPIEVCCILLNGLSVKETSLYFSTLSNICFFGEPEARVENKSKNIFPEFCTKFYSICGYMIEEGKKVAACNEKSLLATLSKDI